MIIDAYSGINIDACMFIHMYIGVDLCRYCVLFDLPLRRNVQDGKIKESHDTQQVCLMVNIVLDMCIYIYNILYRYLWLIPEGTSWYYLYLSCVYDIWNYVWIHKNVKQVTKKHTHTQRCMYIALFHTHNIYIHTHTCICIYIYSTCTHTYIHIYIYIYTCTHTHTYIYIHAHTHTHIYIYIHAHTHTYIYIHMFITLHCIPFHPISSFHPCNTPKKMPNSWNPGKLPSCKLFPVDPY